MFRRASRHDFDVCGPILRNGWLAGKTRGALSVLAALGLLICSPIWADVDEGLVLHAPFEGDCTDVSGNEHHGIVDGTPTYQAGPEGLAIGLPGGVYVDFGSSTDFQFGAGSFTIAFWVKAGVQDSAVLSKYRGETSWGQPGWNLQAENTPTFLDGIRLDYYDDEGNGGEGPGAPLWTGPEALDDTWRHVAFVMDRDGARGIAYLDGNEVHDYDATNLGSADNSTELYLGWRGNWNTFNGLIDELRIYDRALVPYEVQVLAGHPVIFADGFESGGMGVWSSAVP